MGLRRRITWALALYGACLLAVLVVGTIVTLTRTEDDVLRRRVEHELDHQLERMAAGPLPRGELATRDYLTRAWLGERSLPPELAAVASRFSPTVTEFQEDDLWEGSADVFVVRRAAPMQGGAEVSFIVLLDATSVEAQDVWPRRLQGVLLFGGLVALAATAILAVALGRVIVGPLERLTRAVRRSQGRALEQEVASIPLRDELGELGDALSRASARSEAFLEREKNFTRNVSHELRTPLAVISTSTELLEGHVSEGVPAGPVERIGRAVRRMQDTTEALLWLAREAPEDAPEGFGDCDARALVRETLDLARPLAQPRGVELVSEIPRGARVAVPSGVLRVALDNLVRNAIEASTDATVEVALGESGFEVRNPSGGADHESAVGEGGERPRGFGLRIVEEICSRFGWRVRVCEESRAEGGGTRVVRLDLLPGQLNGPDGSFTRS